MKRCIDSIPDREDIEIIVIDDRSDECHKPALRAIAESRQNIRLIELAENRGGGYARNEGLKVASGKWVLFADSDDYFNYCIRDVLDEYLNSEHDIIFFKVTTSDCYTYEFSPRSTLETNKYIDAFIKSSTNSNDNLRYLHGVPYAKLIRRNLIEDNKIRFDCTRMADDTTFAYLAGHYAKNITADPKAIYCVTMRNGSVSQQRTIRQQLDIIDVLGRSVLFMRKIGKPFFENYLGANLYVFIRNKDYENYAKALMNLEKLGLDKSTAEDILITEMGKYSIKSISFCAMFMPSMKMKAKSLSRIFTHAVPYHIKKKLHKKKYTNKI